MNLLFLAHSHPQDFKDMSACLGHVLHVLPDVLAPGTKGPWRLVQFPPDSKSLSKALILTVEFATL